MKFSLLRNIFVVAQDYEIKYHEIFSTQTTTYLRYDILEQRMRVRRYSNT
jgi:hypothetical protein